MAIDRVESERFPYLPVTFTVGQRSHRVDALLDTGFDGYLSVPHELVAGASGSAFQDWELADGSLIRIPYYRATLRVGNLPPSPGLVIVLGDEVILGRAVSDQYRVVLDRGRRVIVEL